MRLALLGALLVALQFLPPTAPNAIRAAPTFDPGERLVATHYFYWYRYPDSHFDALSLHFPGESPASYKSADWHFREMRDVRAAGIDMVLPVYWAVVDAYEKADVAFSVKGLPPLVAALDTITRAGERGDLRTVSGRDVFDRTNRDFFRQVSPRHWAQIGRRPLVVLYSTGFAAGHD